MRRLLININWPENNGKSRVIDGEFRTIAVKNDATW